MKKKGIFRLAGSISVLSFVAVFTLAMSIPVQAAEQKPFELTISTIRRGLLPISWGWRWQSRSIKTASG
jgi:hypothetical protein